MSRALSFQDLVADGILCFGDGYRTKRSELADGGYRIIRVADISSGTVNLAGPDHVGSKFAGTIGNKAGRPNDILVTTKGTVGRVAVLPELTGRVVYSPQVCYFRVEDERVLDRGFLRYWFSSPEFWAQAQDRMNKTDMAAYINLADIQSLKVSLPSINEQHGVASVLGALDDKIAANAELARTADELSRACFDRAMTRPGRTESLLFDRFDVAFGEPFRGSLFSEVGVGRPLIRIRDLYTCAPKLWSTESRVRETLVQAGDVLIGMDAEFTPVVWLGEDGLLNQRVCKVVGRDNLSRVTTRLALTRPISAIESEKSGTTVIHLNKGDLERTRVELPSEHTLEEFDHLANPLHDLTVSLAEESRRLASLRDTLLPHLMSGRMRVRDAEKTVSDAV